MVISRSLKRSLKVLLPLLIATHTTTQVYATGYLFFQAKQQVVPRVLSGTPSLFNCMGSGDVNGLHPGWSAKEAIKLTATKVHNKTYRITWCPAAARVSFGAIAYTVTAQLGGITCVSTTLSCEISGINDGTPLRIMATDQSGSFPSEENAIQNSGIVTICRSGDVGCTAGTPQDAFAPLGDDTIQSIPICTFAAIAHWETIVLGIKADVTEVTSAFSRAGGLPSGLTNIQTFAYWKQNRIGGVFLKTATSLPIDPITVIQYVGDPSVRAVIAQLHFKAGANFAGYEIATDTFHWVVVDGFTPTGPIAISWGQRLQMTWEQWNVEAIAMWSIATR